MLIISVEIMKTIDERETQKTNKDRKEQGEQNSLIFKSNLELAL